LLVKYKLNMRKEIKCACSQETPTILAPFVHVTGLNDRIKNQDIESISKIPQHQAKYVTRWREVNQGKAMCLAQIKQTCSYVAEKKLSDGTLIGVIGSGLKSR